MEEARVFREAFDDQESKEEGPRAQADEKASQASVNEKLLDTAVLTAKIFTKPVLPAFFYKRTGCKMVRAYLKVASVYRETTG